MTRWLGILAALAFAGCAPVRPYRSAAGAQVYSPGFALELPSGWVRNEAETGVTATRDGDVLQMVRVLPWREPLAGMATALPSERAELLMARIVADEPTATILEAAPATLSGLPGARVTYRRTDAGGVSRTTVYVVVAGREGTWDLIYTAASRHYFERDLPTFERALASFRIVPGGK